MLWNAISCSPLEANRRFGRTLHFTLVSYLVNYSIQMMEATCSSETSVHFSYNAALYFKSYKYLTFNNYDLALRN
jgi:hypothetical protein